MREIAASPGIGLAATLEARGHSELQARATTSYEHWVGSEGLTFRARDDAQRLGDVVKFDSSESQRRGLRLVPRRESGFLRFSPLR